MIGITNVVNKRKSEAERMNLTLKTNQSEHTDLLGVNFTLTYGTYTKSYTWNGSTITIEVPNGVEYTLTFPDVEGYACNTKSVTYTAQSGNSRMLEVLYQCELLTVNVSADSGSVSGFEVKIQKVETVGTMGYTRLEYIEATGSQYIDTGIQPSATMKSELDFQFTQNNSDTWCFSALQTSGNSGVRVGVYQNAFYLVCATSSQASLLERTKFTVNPTYSVPLNMYLFAENRNGSAYGLCAGKLYSCKIYNNGVLVRDYIPAMNSDGVAGLYDAVNDTFTLPSSGTFVYNNQLGEVISTQTSTTGVYKIPYGVSYSIQGSSVLGYIAPNPKVYTASTPQNVVSMMYVYIPHDGTLSPTNGIYIQDIDGYCYKKSEWDSKYTPNGIAVVTDQCKFVISLEEPAGSVAWSSNESVVPGVLATLDYNTALTDYKGEQNTSKIISYLGTGNAPAAEKCASYVFPNGKKGYLASFGELKAILDNYESIMGYMDLCGADRVQSAYWSSTQYNASRVWFATILEGTTSLNLKSEKKWVRPLTTLN